MMAYISLVGVVFIISLILTTVLIITLLIFSFSKNKQPPKNRGYGN